tara:strand:+ start:1831 stop:2436 length:606 start_codon:yes stop_codon:yes gene_type:complete
MSKLLKEATVRRFMKLASIGPLSDGFVNESWGEKEDEYKRKDVGGVEKKAGDEDGHYKDYMKEEDELEATEDELGAEDSLAGEEGAEIVDLEADLGAEEADGAAVSEEDVVDIVATIATALEDKYGIAVDVESGAEEAEMGADMDMGGDEMEAEVDMDVGGDELDVEMVDDEEVVAEVLKRVTARLREAIKKDKKTKITRK